ncbi:MAG: hypothetical protein AVDCRST_MAG59-4059, partial [uncultured Thermomicrobiales bacterium]
AGIQERGGSRPGVVRTDRLRGRRAGAGGPPSVRARGVAGAGGRWQRHGPLRWCRAGGGRRDRGGRRPAAGGCLGGRGDRAGDARPSGRPVGRRDRGLRPLLGPAEHRPGRPRRPGAVRERDRLRQPFSRLRRVLDRPGGTGRCGLRRPPLRGRPGRLRGHRDGSPPRFPEGRPAGAGRLLRDDARRGEAAGAPLGAHPRPGGSAPRPDL